VLRTEKERVVSELVERLRSADTLIVADYRGLDVKQIYAVRTEVLKHGAKFSVVKNTLTKRAAEEAGLDSLVELLDGPTAIAFVEDGDMVAVAKALNDAARDTKVLTLKGGIMQGTPISADQVKDLASLPPLDLLQGQVVAAIVGPLNAVVNLFSAPLRDFVGVLEARIQQLESEAPAPAEPEASEEEPATEEPAAEKAPEEEPAAEEPAAEEAPEPEAEAAPEPAETDENEEE
jgi:large subunit ribosomal protein L10